MRLIKILNRRLSKSKNYFIAYAIFWCDSCQKEVEKYMQAGLKAKSCGCQKDVHKKKHGGFGTRLYTIYYGIKTRCLNKNSKDYPNYGGRGITICPEWTESYIVFRDWSLSNGYADNLTIDRINNNGNYEPSNCQWLTSEENSQKQSTTILNMEKAKEIRVKYNSGYYTQKQLAKEYNIDQSSISLIISNKIWK